MESKHLPSLHKVVAQDGRNAPILISRRLASNSLKLPVPPGVKLTLTRAKVGDTLYKPPTDFLRTGPSMSIMMPDYNSLHDPHLRHYYQRKDLKQRLRQGNFITENNEVICSLKDYNMYEEYLRGLRVVAERNRVKAQMDRMDMLLEAQGKGLIPRRVTISEMTEKILDDDAGKLEQLLKTEFKWQSHREKKTNEDDFFTKLDLLQWREEDRAQFMIYEKQYRHNQNREKYLRAVRDQKDKKNQVMLVVKYVSLCKKMEEAIRGFEEFQKSSAKQSRGRRRLEKALRSLGESPNADGKGAKNADRPSKTEETESMEESAKGRRRRRRRRREEERRDLEEPLQEERKRKKRSKKRSETEEVKGLEDSQVARKTCDSCSKILEGSQTVKNQPIPQTKDTDETAQMPARKEQPQQPKSPSQLNRVQQVALAVIYGQRAIRMNQQRQKTREESTSHNATREASQIRKQNSAPRKPAVDVPVQQSVRAAKHIQKGTRE